MTVRTLEARPVCAGGADWYVETREDTGNGFGPWGGFVAARDMEDAYAKARKINEDETIREIRERRERDAKRAKWLRS